MTKNNSKEEPLRGTETPGGVHPPWLSVHNKPKMNKQWNFHNNNNINKCSIGHTLAFTSENSSMFHKFLKRKEYG